MLKPGHLCRRNIGRIGVDDLGQQHAKRNALAVSAAIGEETKGNSFSTEKTVQFFCF